MNCNQTKSCSFSTAQKAYWADVVRCVARRDGSGEIHHSDGWVERLDDKGLPIREKSKNRQPAAVTLNTAQTLHNISGSESAGWLLAG